jgi:hypothetical protein
MQNRYVGDVGDFGKYALLRRLSGLVGERRVHLGIVWCLFPNEDHNGDGRHIAYIDAADFQDLDQSLISRLRVIIQGGRRDVLSVISGDILAPGTVSCHELITPQKPCSAVDRLSWRSAWIERCFELTANCELVFFDPDNGLEVNSVPKTHAKAGKYIYWDELSRFWKRGNTLFIYHHLNRTLPTVQQIQILKLRFTAEFHLAHIVPLVFRRGSSRVFWLVHRGDADGRELERRAASLLSSGWSRHFWPFGWPSDVQASTAAGSRSII